jgi:hypothetical protein
VKTRTQPATSAPKSGPQLCSLDPIPGVGACGTDILFLAKLTLMALGVSPNGADGTLSESSIVEQAIQREMLVLDLVIEAQRDDSSAAAVALLGVRDRLSLIVECASILATINTNGRVL